MTRPVVGSIAEDVYASVAAFSAGDASHEYALLHLCEAMGMQNQVILDLMVETDEGVGWSALFDIDRCPVWALDWLGQHVGVRVPPSITDDTLKRAWIKDAAGWRRGRVSSLQAAVRDTLTGLQRVVVRQRFDPSDPSVDSPGHIQIKTYTSETPSSDATERAARAAKRGLLVMHFDVVDGQDLLQLETNHTTLGDIEAAYATLADISDDIPI